MRSWPRGELELVGVYHAGYKGHGALNVVVGIDQLVDFMKKKRRLPRALTAEGSPGSLGLPERGRIKDALAAGTLPLFDLGGLVVRVEINDGVLMYHLYGRQFPLDDRRIVVIEDLVAKTAAFGETGRMWVLGQTGWREWPPAALGTDERDLVARVVDTIRIQMLHTLDYRHALANPSSADERRRGRDVSRTIARDQPLTRDLAQNLLETADRLSSAGKELTAAATPPAPPPAPSPRPVRGAP